MKLSSFLNRSGMSVGQTFKDREGNQYQICGLGNQFFILDRKTGRKKMGSGGGAGFRDGVNTVVDMGLMLSILNCDEDSLVRYVITSGVGTGKTLSEYFNLNSLSIATGTRIKFTDREGNHRQGIVTSAGTSSLSLFDLNDGKMICDFESLPSGVAKPRNFMNRISMITNNIETVEVL